MMINIQAIWFDPNPIHVAQIVKVTDPSKFLMVATDFGRVYS